MSFANKRVVITGASRGIGEAIALRLAKEGATIVLVAKTADPHPKLPGTIYSVAEQVEAAGGKAIPFQLDIRDDERIQVLAHTLAEQLGGIDVLINNASAISLTPTQDTAMKRYDLMQSVNARGTFAMSQAMAPLLQKGTNPHILTLSPPLNLSPNWFKHHLAYTMSKYGMSMCTLGMAEEFKPLGIAVNSLWPYSTIATSAIEFNFQPEMLARSRKVDIMSDAVSVILAKDAKENTGNFYIDEEVLRESGVTDFEHYAVDPSQPLMMDLFLEHGLA